MSTDTVENKHSWLAKWLIEERKPRNSNLCDFDRLTEEVKTGDVLLVEGRSRVGAVIKTLSQSPWSHSFLYLGKLDSIQTPSVRNLASTFLSPQEREQPIILEALFGKGVILSPLEKYRDEHIRICRPIALSAEDAQKVMNHALKNLGKRYDARQIFDLLRFLLPIRLLPRRWLSTLFRYEKGRPTEEICSSMLVNAFDTVGFPVRPIIKIKDNDEIELIKRNPRLFTPSDFDYSPYFQIIKYPFYGTEKPQYYQDLNWNTEGKLANSEDEIIDLQE